jgi:hypothetical protein
MEFESFEKIARLSRDCVITEKIDGTNGCIAIGDNGEFFVGSRSRWITPEDDNYGFARWAEANKDELLKLGPGRHWGEWWGAGIQRRYGLLEKRFSLFNVHRWADAAVRPACCHVVPVLYSGPFTTYYATEALRSLETAGSVAAPGFMDPEGIVIFHSAAAGHLFKKTIKGDEEGKHAEATPAEAERTAPAERPVEGRQADRAITLRRAGQAEAATGGIVTDTYQ